MKIEKQDLDELIIEEVHRVLNEGTWIAPKTEEKALKLWELFQDPIRLENASNELFSLVGNDELFNRFKQLKDNDYPSDYDVRPIVADFLKKWNPPNERRWSGEWSEAGKQVIDYIVKKFGSDTGSNSGGYDFDTATRTNGHA